jgi:flagellar assembly protein FliH
MSLERKRGFLRFEDDENVEAKDWGLPDYTAETNADAKETAFNYDPGWIPQRAVEEEPEAIPLTVEEIEKIRADAQQEGLLLGKEAGFKQGYDKGKEEGLAAGHEEGVTQGIEEGLSQGQEIINQQVVQLVAMLDKLSKPIQLVDQLVEKQLVDMVLALTKEVVHLEVQTNPQIILDTLKQSIDVLPITGREVTIKLNPDDTETVLNAFGEEEVAQRNWTLVKEPSLSNGDIEVQAADSVVNYKMEERVRTVLTSFCGSNRHQAAPSGMREEDA